MNKKIKFLSVPLSLLICFSMFMAGCGASKSSTNTAGAETKSAQSTSKNDSNLSVGNDSNGTNSTITDNNNTNTQNTTNTTKPKDNSKIIKTANVELQTKTFDKTVNSILKSVDDKGGYIQNSKSYGNNDEDNTREANYTIRIPKDYFETFLSNVGNLGKVISCSTTGDNISSQYYDTQAHIKALQVQEQRLLELIKQSGSLKDMLEIENQLSNVRYQIESLTSTMKNWDNEVEYATVNINIHEVKELTVKPVSYGGKIKQTFSTSLKSLGEVLKVLLLIIIAIVPYLVIIIPVSIIIYIVYKKRKNADKK